MPSITNTLSRPDPILSQIALGFTNEDTVGPQLSPVIPVDDRKGQYPSWGMEAFTLPTDTLRAPRTKANAVDFAFTYAPYSMEQHALDFEYAEEERQNYDRIGQLIGANALFDMERNGVKLTEDKLQLRREKTIGDILRNNPVPGETLSGAAQWSDSSADIPAAARKARNEVRKKTGKIVNTALIPFEVDDVILWHSSTKAFLGGNERKFVDMDLLRRIFRVQNIITPSMVYNLGTEASPDLHDIWGKDVIFAYVNPAGAQDRSQLQQSFSYTFRYRWTNNESASVDTLPTQAGTDQSMPVTAWYDQNTETHIRRVKYEEKTHIVSPNCAYVFREAIA